MNTLRPALSATVLLFCAATLIGCNREDGPGGGSTNGQARPPSTSEDKLAYHFVLEGPHPRDDTFYYAVGSAVDGDAAYAGAILNERSLFVIEGSPGDAYHVRTEPRMTPADVRMRWSVDLRGTLGDAADAGGNASVNVTAPEKARIQVVVGPSSGGPDFVTLYDEVSKTAACAVRDANLGLITAAWDARGKGNAFRESAPPRPWVIEEFAPGPCVVGARAEGRQWMAIRVDLGAGAAIDMDVGRQPKGGGIVICEDPNAVLLLAGEFAIPAPRRTTALQFRSRWAGVPPGKHKVRYPDGRVEEIAVTNGEETRLGK